MVIHSSLFPFSVDPLDRAQSEDRIQTIRGMKKRKDSAKTACARALPPLRSAAKGPVPPALYRPDFLYCIIRNGGMQQTKKDLTKFLRAGFCESLTERYFRRGSVLRAGRAFSPAVFGSGPAAPPHPRGLPDSADAAP